MLILETHFKHFYKWNMFLQNLALHPKLSQAVKTSGISKDDTNVTYATTSFVLVNDIPNISILAPFFS
jgi:hypothetical protein